MARLRDVPSVFRQIGIATFAKRVWQQINEDAVFTWGAALAYSWMFAIFPFLVTGWITSAGGAWNASIVAEYVQQGGRRYNAFGLGDLISQATGQGRFDVLAAAVLVMALTVVTINRILWRRLQRIGDYYCRFGG